MRKPRALVLHAAGTNRDPDACVALGLAGAEPEIVHVKALRAKERRFEDYDLLVIPGGFSYADALGAGRLFALDLASYFEDEVEAFVAAGKPVIGICNGFQVLVKAGILPGPGRRSPGAVEQGDERRATLARNENGRFECRWVRMAAPSSKCVWTRSLQENGGILACPVAHGEGRFVVDAAGTLDELESAGRIALVYVDGTGRPAGGAYPANPNGSVADIAGICNAAGNVLGLMPHPENNVVYRNRAGAISPLATAACLELWKSGVEYAAEC
jgi:phosphoribosylformylglycinamidine synthase